MKMLSTKFLGYKIPGQTLKEKFGVYENRNLDGLPLNIRYLLSDIKYRKRFFKLILSYAFLLLQH